MGDHVHNADWLIDMHGNELHTGMDFLGDPRRELLLCHTLCKVDQHVILKIFDGFHGLEFLTFLGVNIDQLIGLLDIHSARDGGLLANHGNRTDQQILGLTQGRIGQFPLFERFCVQRCHEKTVQLFCIAALNQTQHLTLKIVCTVQPLIFPGQVGIFRMLLPNHLLVSGVGNAERLSYAELFAGQRVMQIKQKVQKLIIGILWDTT